MKACVAALAALFGFAAQGVAWAEPGYFGQPKPGLVATPFVYTGVDIAGLKPRSPVFSADGNLVVFNAGEPSQIYISERRRTGWTRPVLAPFSNVGSNWEPFITKDQTSVIFVSSRAPGEANRGRAWRTDRLANGSWSFPRLAFDLDDPAGVWFPNGSASQALYFSGELKDQLGNSDLYKIDPSQPSAAPERLEINTPFIEWDPLVSPDGRLMVFVSDRPGGAGRTDIWLSRLDADGRWGEPVNAGPAINTEANEVAATFSPDGAYMFFVREPGALFWISTQALGLL